MTQTHVAAGGQRIRVDIRQGTGVPLVLCNGIGASLEVRGVFISIPVAEVVITLMGLTMFMRGSWKQKKI